MPLVQVKVIEGVFSDAQKQEMIHKLTDAMVSIEGEDAHGDLGCRRRGQERELGHRGEGPDHCRRQGPGEWWVTRAYGNHISPRLASRRPPSIISERVCELHPRAEDPHPDPLPQGEGA